MQKEEERIAEGVLDRLRDLENYPEEHLAPYREFEVGVNTYYFTPSGFLYRKDPGAEEVGAPSAVISPTRFGTTGPTTDRGRFSPSTAGPGHLLRGAPAFRGAPPVSETSR